MAALTSASFTLIQRNALRLTVQSNRVEYLAACGEVRRLSGEVRRAKWEAFLADLEGNPDPARAWNLIKSLSGSPHSIAFCEPLIHSGRTGKRTPSFSNMQLRTDSHSTKQSALKFA